MKWKCCLISAIVFFVVSNVIGIAVTGPIIHEGVLDSAYQASESFWRPELRQDPPDIGAMMPIWLLNSFLASLVIGWLYCLFRRCVGGPGWQRGLKIGLCLAVFGCSQMLGWSGLFALPAAIWLWWALDYAIIYAVAGIAMGWAAGKWAAED